MANLFKMENRVILCDICNERPMVEVVKFSIGNWKGVCKECKPEGKNEPNQAQK